MSVRMSMKKVMYRPSKEDLELRLGPSPSLDELIIAWARTRIGHKISDWDSVPQPTFREEFQCAQRLEAKLKPLIDGWPLVRVDGMSEEEVFLQIDRPLLHALRDFYLVRAGLYDLQKTDKQCDCIGDLGNILDEPLACPDYRPLWGSRTLQRLIGAEIYLHVLDALETVDA